MINPNRKRTSSELKGAVLGTLLGDSSITQNMFCCEQISKELIEYKKYIIEQIISKEININVRRRDPRIVHNNNKQSIFKPTYSIRVRHKYFEKLKTELYKSNGKQVSMSILNKLTDEGLALWLMDDGTMYYSPSNSTKYLRICTDSYDEFSIKQIQQFFSERYNVETKIYYHNSGNGADKKPRIQFNAKNAQVIISKVYKYFLPEYYYKLNLHYTEKTINSIRCSDAYRQAYNYMLQHSS